MADKPEVIPLAPEEREEIERVGAEVDEKLETPSVRSGVRDMRDANGEGLVVREAEAPLADIRVALADIERLAVLAYTGVTILLDRFAVTDEQFANTVKATVDFLRRRNQPPAEPAGAPQGEQK